MKYTGILEDNRSQSLKEKDFDVREVDMGEVKWITKKEAVKNAEEYIFRNQYHKSSCVPSSICNALWNTEHSILADEYLYTQRSNKPQEGCYWYNIADLVVQQGICQREFLNEVQSETEANKVKITQEQRGNAELQKQNSYLFIEKPTVDELAKWSNQGFAVPFSVFTTRPEWAQEYPDIINLNLNPAKATINHAICVIPNTGYIEKKKKYVIITDSAHFGKIHTRHLSEDFLANRSKHGVVFTDFIKEINKPTPYIFTKNLKVKDTGEEVLKLQETLQDLGFFPVNIKPTGYFGGMTRQAVKDFQKKYEKDILWVLGLKTPTGYFGESTRKKLNKLISNQ